MMMFSDPKDQNEEAYLRLLDDLTKEELIKLIYIIDKSCAHTSKLLDKAHSKLAQNIGLITR